MKTHRTTWDCRPSWIFSVILGLGAGLLSGCGGANPHSAKPTAQVAVTVTYGGQAVTAGRVDLSNEQTGEGGGGELNAQGVAKIPGVALGEYTVVVVPPEREVVPGAAEQPAAAKNNYANIPAKVRSLKTSPLKAAVKKDSPNQFTFELKEG